MPAPDPTPLLVADVAAWRAWLDAHEHDPDGVWLILAEIDRAKSDGLWDAAYAGAATMEVPEDLAEMLARGETPHAR